MRYLADHPSAAWVVAACAFLIAGIGARPFAAGFNDGSRLATAESLIERGTLAIDDSPFLGTQAAPGLPSPYPDSPGLLRVHGTLDRVYIDGHYYSDKPAVPAVLLAAGYRALMMFGLPRPGERPDVFCRVAAMLMCGLGFAATVGCLWTLGIRVGLSPGWRLVWVVSFAFSTMLLAYTRHVNSGVPQAAAVAGLAVLFLRIAERERRWLALVGAGCLAGFGYSLDGGSGPPLFLAAFAVVAIRTQSVGATSVFILAALPWIAAHHILNFCVGHVWVPLGMVPEYLVWPGSPFDRSNMTGIARHTPGSFATYGIDLLFGSTGFLLWNLPLLLVVVFGWLRYRQPNGARLEQTASIVWCVATWLIYAALSDNAGGGCLSVRWFVPFLVPGFWWIAQLLVDRPSFRWDFLVLSAWGLVIGWQAWTLGPWPSESMPNVRSIAWAAVGSWAAVRLMSVWRWTNP